jgi:autotransporter-associated beta strand protein
VATGAGALGASGASITVNSGGTLALAGSGTPAAPMTITKSASLSLAGTGAAGSNGALVASGATGTVSQFNGNISLAGNTTIGAADNLLTLGEGNTFTNTLNLGANTLTVNTPVAATATPIYSALPSYLLDKTNVQINSAISGTGGITKTGAGTLSLVAVATGGNTFTGDLVIQGGKVIVDGVTNTPGVASGNIVVGNSGNIGAGVTSTLQIGQLASTPASSNTIGTFIPSANSSATNLTIYEDGQFTMNNGSNGFANLTLKGGLVDGGLVSNSPTLTVSGGITTLATSQTAVLRNGVLALSANNFAFNVASGTTGSGIDLQVDDIIQNGVGYTGSASGTSFVKSGTGTLVLTGAGGANTYQGLTNINAGILNIQSATSLGQVGSFLGDTSNGTVVQSGAQLQLQKSAGMTIGIESLTLNGTGISGSGALRNVAGNNTWNGYVYLGSDSRINADSGTTLTIANTSGVNSGIINGTAAGKNLTFGGDGNTTVNGGISSFVNNVIKDGNGTLTLAGNNGYAGATNATSGAVKVTNNNGLSGTGVTVTSGAALQFAQTASNADINVIAVGSTLNGTGLAGGGAIQNIVGNNTYQGAISLASNSSLTANAGSSLTLTGGMANSVPATHRAVEFGGSGNITENGAITTGSVTTSGGKITATGTGGTLTKTGTGTLTLGGGAASTLDGITLTLGNINVTGTNTLVQSGALSSSNANNILTIDSTNKVQSFYAAATSTNFTGKMAGGGTFQKDGAGTLVFDTSFTATNLSLIFSEGTINLANANITVGTIRITGNVTLDFGGAASTLTSTNLILDTGASVNVKNWASGTDFWYALSAPTQQTPNTNTVVNTAVANATGSAPENQITFGSGSGNWDAAATTWYQSPSPHGTYSNNEIRPVPEPSTYGAIFISGCLALVGWRRFSSRKFSAAK